VDVELARQQWDDGNRRMEETRGDPARYRRLMEQVDVVIGGLRMEIGQTFTLAELAAAYDRADDWARTILDEADPEAAPILEPGTVTDAAFHLYAQGAVDYSP
jgi:hypothetical protein